MNTGRLVFSQLMDFLPMQDFHRCVARYRGNHKVKSFLCYSQFLCMVFAQLTHRESLRDIEASLRAVAGKLYHTGFRGQVSRNTLAHANQIRDWRIYRDFAHRLIEEARSLYADEALAVDLDATAYALDASTIELCLTLFPWATFKQGHGGIKLHTLLDLRGNIPTWCVITDALTHEIRLMDQLVYEAGAYYILDRGYIDFARLFRIDRSGAFFVTRIKTNTAYRVVESRPVPVGSGVLEDQLIVFTSRPKCRRYPDQLRRIRYHDAETDRELVFLTNHLDLDATIIAGLYRSRWQIELFFRWIKQNLRIKVFYGTSKNAVKTQIWIAISVYVLVAIIKKRLGLTTSLSTMLQILSVTLFEKKPINQLLTTSLNTDLLVENPNQLKLFS
ncbi:IS4 family transposase [bacterium]|nr:IS4 family transposase [bacterium]